MTRRRILRWALLTGAAVLAILVISTVVFYRPGRLRERIAQSMSEHLGLEASIGELSLSLFPRPRVSGSGLTLRLSGRPELPPFITVATFWVDVGLASALRGHADTVHLVGLEIVVPPGDAKSEIRSAMKGGTGGTSSVGVDHLEAPGARLTILRRKPDQEPIVFEIHELRIEKPGYDLAMPFVAKLTNPKPTGLVETRGTIGPWQKGNPSALPMAGDYTFTNADLSAFDGIAGRLTSRGTYEGRLAEIAVVGETNTPDFTLDLGGKPVPLSAKFKALVNATDGTTRLEDVQAQLFNTAISARGAITNLPGPGQYDLALDVDVRDGRIEDVLRLVVDPSTPLLVGDAMLQAKLLLPPGPAPVRQRLRLAGRFGLEEARFTDQQIQGKLQELSRRSQGKDDDERIGRVLTSLSGRFTLAAGTVRFADLAFRVPGATVALSGTYTVDGGALDLAGTLRMDTSVSNAVGGFKSIFIKPFNFLFAKEGARAVVPITITGTREAPKVGISLGKVLKGKDP